MPQLGKGGKWVFGWTVVNSAREVRIPPEAYAEYGFQTGEQVVFLNGSQRSGGCGVARREKLVGSQIPLAQRMLGEGVVGDDEHIVFPSEAGIQPGERLLVVRGSWLALGFLQRGPIYEEALQHSEIEVFSMRDGSIFRAMKP
jgi:hypothetical protein